MIEVTVVGNKITFSWVTTGNTYPYSSITYNGVVYNDIYVKNTNTSSFSGFFIGVNDLKFTSSYGNITGFISEDWNFETIYNIQTVMREVTFEDKTSLTCQSEDIFREET